MPETVVLYKIVWYGVKCACILREGIEQDEEQDLASQLSGGGCGLGTGTEAEINGAVTFLKWFTEPQNNIAFAVESGYLPVTTAANDMDAIRASGLELTDDYFEAWYQATLAQLQQYEG